MRERLDSSIARIWCRQTGQHGLDACARRHAKGELAMSATDIALFAVIGFFVLFGEPLVNLIAGG